MIRNPDARFDESCHDSTVSQNIAWHGSKVAAADRTRLLRQEPATVWLTGLSGAGKSTIAFEVEKRLFALGHASYVLDGDNVRHGLNRDLGFSHGDRTENIRRIAELARLFNEAGLIVIAAFISPYRQDRVMAREIIGPERFIETHLCAELEVCEQRDPKGLYKKARQGAIAEFTGVTAPYEVPEDPELKIDTGRSTVEDSVSAIIKALAPRLFQAEPIAARSCGTERPYSRQIDLKTSAA
ncbi:MAG: adenylyl-sulfate kinase [Rhodocyclales bacterium RIFCSPLOWO2_02_FULL_63_24]|nr:MAG: adenylyl-sulfate kinase [Rhodocyclales bacterium RIFCSPLOWO2_02_FULL_63_24]